MRRGTEYGGWWFEADERLRNGLVVCAGAGEDVSFDVALAAEFGAEVIIVDPTPRAIEHVHSVLARIGQSASTNLVTGGRQSPESYNLSHVRPGQMRLLPYAVWNADDELLFHPPLDPTHVSHSIEDWRRDSTADPSPPPLRVEGRRLSTLLGPTELDRIEILKLDIEGAEIEVIEDILTHGICPRQILVEFDQLQQPSKSHLARVRATLHLLSDAGYRLLRREQFNYSFGR